MYVSLGLWFLLAFHVLNTEEIGLELHNLSQHHVPRGGHLFWSWELPIYFFYNALNPSSCSAGWQVVCSTLGVFFQTSY